jgi:WD40 repeat protein
VTSRLSLGLTVMCALVVASAHAADPPTTWKHDGGTFQKVDDKKWVEKVGTDTFELSVKSAADDKVTLIDLKRKLSITLSAGKAVVIDLDAKLKPKQLKGDWVKAVDDKKPDAKGVAGTAADRVAWKYAKGLFERTAKDKWTETTSDGKKTEYEEKARTDEYVELFDAAGKRSVRLMEKIAVEKGEKNREYRPILGKGEWVAGTGSKVDPGATTKPALKFTETATMRMDDAPEPDPARTVPGFSPDGKLVARRTGKLFEEQFAVVELATGKAVQSWPKGEYILTSAWSADGKTLAGLSRGELNKRPSQVVVWDTATWKEKARLDLPNEPKVISVSGDGKYVATSSVGVGGDQYACVFDVAKKKLAFDVKTAKKVFDPPPVVLSADGKTAAVGRCGKDGDMIGLFDVPSGKPRATFKGGENFTLSADGGLLVDWTSSQAAGTTITIYDTKAGPKAEPRTIKDDKWLARSVTFLDNNSHLAAGVAQVGKDSRTGGVRVYSLKTLEPVELFTFGKPEKEEPGPRVWATPDSAFLLTQTNDQTLRLFSTTFGPKGKP